MFPENVPHESAVQNFYGPTIGEPVTAEFIRDFANRWEIAWNSQDTDTVVALLHPEIRWNDNIFWTEIIHGHEKMRAYTDKLWTVMPDVRYREVQLFTAPEDGRALYLFEQTVTAPPSTGSTKQAVTYGCDIFLGFKDGLLCDYMAQYELTEMMRQFGMLPPRGGRVGGSYLMSLMKAGAVKA